MESVALSTAAFCLWGISPEDKLGIARSLRFREIEIALSTERMVRDFIRFLEAGASIPDFERISVHAPWHRARYGRNAPTERILQGLRRIGDHLPVAEYVFHADCIEAPETLARWGRPVCVENACGGHGDRMVTELLRRFEFTLALNMNRVARENQDPQALIREFGQRITRLPLSGHTGQLGRVPMKEAGQLHLLEVLQGVKAPPVLEGLFQPGDTLAIKEERWAVQRALFTGRRPQGALSWGPSAPWAENVV